MRKKGFKKWIVTSAVTVVLALAVVVCWKTDVFGKFTPEEPYVKGEAESLSSVVVTSPGSNWMGAMGTGAKPATKDVPTCEGKKGSETNPFVILEVVADKAQQQMTYLGMDDNSAKPLDILQIGIDVAKDEGKSYVPGSSSYMSNNDLRSVGEWFCNWDFEVHAIGNVDKKENIHFTDIQKLYSLKITSDDLKDAGIDADEFKQQFNTGKKTEFSRDMYDVPALIKKYPDLFQEDDDKKEIRKPAKEDIYNWAASYESKVTKEAVVDKYSGNGYILAVEPGKGDFGFASESDCNNWIFTKTGTNADRWVYVENEEDLPAESVERYKAGIAKIDRYGFWDNDKPIWHEGTASLYTKYLDSDDITGLYLDLSKENGLTCQYIVEPEETKDIYTFDYYGIANNNILKRQLFQFKTQKECDDFHMQVICMTPEELNAMAKKDTDDTVDMIERADMFYLGGYDSDTYEIKDIYKLYYKFVKGQSEYDTTEILSFLDQDLEWDLCYKLIYRLCNNKNLPLVMTNVLGKIATEGTATISMYQNETFPNVSRRATLNNLAKLYIIASQFDLTARKEENENFVRTFYDDILIPGKLQKVALTKGAQNSSDSPAQFTGYYQRPKVIQSEDKIEREKCYYLWNTLTFFPEALEGKWFNETQCSTEKADVDDFVNYGYMRSYFDVDASSKLFSDGSEAEKVDGAYVDSDGEMHGNVTIPHNQNNTGYSTLLGNTESSYVTNGAMDISYMIMNNRPETINNQVLKVMKQKKEYVKMSDSAILLDYTSDRSYGDKKSYVKLQIHANNNGQNGLVTKIRLKNSEGKTAPQDGELLLYDSATYTKECEKDTYGSNSGYIIPSTDTLTAYVPYSLQQWADGYNIIEVETVGRILSQKGKTKGKVILGEPVTTEIDIGERTLFNLE